MQYDQNNFLKQYHQVTLFVYENKLKLCNHCAFLLRLKAVFSNKLHFTYDSRHMKGTLILSMFSQWQNVYTILSQS